MNAKVPSKSKRQSLFAYFKLFWDIIGIFMENEKMKNDVPDKQFWWYFVFVYVVMSFSQFRAMLRNIRW